jgi:uncharacterized membrane protein
VIRLTNFLALVRAQLWLLPAFMSLGALALAYVMLADPWKLQDFGDREFWWLYSGDARTAGDLLSTLLSGMMTMTSLVISMTFVILTLAANQLGPRLIRNFIGDRQIQAVLGLFLGTILYTAIILRTLDETLGTEGVPHLAVTTATALMLVCVFALLFYIHKIARSIVSDTVVEQVGDQLRVSVEAMLPARRDHAAPEEIGDLPPHAHWMAIGRQGYIQTIDYPALVAWAARHDLVLRLLVRPGHFVLTYGDHIEVLAGGMLSEEQARPIRAAFQIGAERSPTQDLEFSIRQLVEVALRALSSGIKDPFTVLAVLDRLGAALEGVLSRQPQPTLLCADDGKVRVIANRSDFVGLVEACFDQIRQSSSDQPAILIHMADTLGKLSFVLEREEVRETVLRQLDMMDEAAARLPGEHDRERTAARIAEARARCTRRAAALSSRDL